MAHQFFCSINVIINYDCYPKKVLIYFSKAMKNLSVVRNVIFGALCLFFAVQFPCASSAQEWSVAPIKLDFSGGTTSGVITVTNDSSSKFTYQMNAFQWTQDKDGKDVYTETSDIIFYPKLMSIEPKDQKIIRVGTKIPRGDSEKTYRLFIEDITRPAGATGATVVFAIRFGVPIFFKPIKEDIKASLDPLAMVKGIITVPVRNVGNSHFVVQKIMISGIGQKNETVLSKELPGWYVLTGTLKKYTMEIPRESCQRISRIQIEVKTEQFTLKDSLNVQKAMCLR